MPETVEHGDIPGNGFSEISVYRGLSDLQDRVEDEPVKALRGSIKVSRPEWIDEVVEQENWLGR